MKYKPGKRLGCINPMQIYFKTKLENMYITSTVLLQEKNSTIKRCILV